MSSIDTYRYTRPILAETIGASCPSAISPLIKLRGRQGGPPIRGDVNHFQSITNRTIRNRETSASVEDVGEYRACALFLPSFLSLSRARVPLYLAGPLFLFVPRSTEREYERMSRRGREKLGGVGATTGRNAE